MAKVLSIELGHSVIKLCEMDYKVKKPKIYQCQEAITPAGAVQDGYIDENKMRDLAYSIKETIARNGIKTKKVIFTVASGKIINREVMVPNVKEAQIASVIQANLSEYFPVSLADYEITQSLVQTLSEGADAGKHRVLVFAAEKSMLDQYKRLAAECGLDILNVCCSGASIIESARNNRAAGCQAIIKMEEKYSIISVMKDGVLLLQRSINYGVGDAMNVVATQPSFAAGDTLGVWRLITRQNCTTEAVSNVKEAGRPEARAAVTEALNPLLSGVMRVFDYFASHFNGEEIENVSIIGLGAQFIGVAEILGESLGIVCKKAGMFQDLDAVDSDVRQKSDAYFSCIGAGFSGEGFLHDVSKDKAKKQTDYTLLTVLAVVVVLVGAAALTIMAVMPYNAAKKELEQLKAENEKYQVGVEVHEELVGIRNVNQKFLHGYSLSKHLNDGLLMFLGELETNLPEDVEILEFVSDDKSCGIRMVVTDKEKAAKVTETIRNFDSVLAVSVTTLTEKEITYAEGVQRPDDALDTEVDFTLYCIFLPLIIEPEEYVEPSVDANVVETPQTATAQ